MSWKNRYRSFYYETAGQPEDIVIDKAHTALLVIDIQNEYMKPEASVRPSADQQTELDRWAPFYTRMEEIVIPNVGRLLKYFRDSRLEVIFARIACLTADGRDRSLSQKKPGWNNLLMPVGTRRAEIVKEIAPRADEIVVTKTTDSALTGTNLRLILTNLGIRDVIVTGIFTDQCVSSTVRSLADESFNVIVIDDCCAAGTDELHEKELCIINNIYCNVMGLEDLLGLLAKEG